MAYWDATFSSRPNIRMRFHVNQGNQNYGGNYTTLNLAVEIIETAQQPSWNLSSTENWWSFTVAGQTFSGNFTFDFRPSGLQSWYLWYGSVNVSHDGNGYGWAGVGGSAGAGVLGSANIGAQGFSPSRIPKVPAAPTPIGADEIKDSSLRFRFSGNDDGGTQIREWQAQIASNSGFTNNLQTVNSYGTTTFTGLLNHTQWSMRARGRNDIGWGPWSSVTTASTLGHPTAPLNLTATPSTTVTGRMSLSWTAPATPGAGGILGYDIYRNGTKIASPSGTGTSYTDTGLVPYNSYTYTVAARNAYSATVSGSGPQSAAATVSASGAPGAPRNLVAVSNASVPGRADLSWVAPLTPGAGGVTGYKIYRSEGQLVATINGTGTSHSVTGLTPGSTYTFFVTARNALSDAEGSQSIASNYATVTPVGEPPAPTGLSVTPSANVPRRLVLSWTASGAGLSGFNVYRRVGNTDTLIAQLNSSLRTFTVDDLTPGTSYTYVVRGRTVYTDSLPTNGYPGNWGGPASEPASGTPVNDSNQTVSNVNAIVSNTNAVFAGAYTINAITPNTIGYAKVGPNITTTVSGGSIFNNTNQTFNGTYTITGIPVPTSFTYAKTAANVANLVANGSVTNNTNTAFSGTFSITAVNAGANLLSYANTGTNIASVSVPVNAAPGKSSKIVNLSNAVFNGTNKVILSSTENTVTYAQISANVSESNAAGTITNVTNRDTFNGVYVVTSIPDFNIVKYARTADAVPLRTWEEPNGRVYRTKSPAILNVHFRSGWAG